MWEITVTLGYIFPPARHALDTGALHNTFHAGVVLAGVVKKCARAEATKAFYAQLTPEQQSVFDAQAKTHRHQDHASHQS